jgi:hypothetical protein
MAADLRLSARSCRFSKACCLDATHKRRFERFRPPMRWRGRLTSAAKPEKRASRWLAGCRGHPDRTTDSTIASLAICLLDLGPDSPVDSVYVKGLRQRLRGAGK